MINVERSFDIKAFDKVAQRLLSDDAIGFDAFELITNPNNVLLWDGADNYSLFEYADYGIYLGHYFFTSARGKTAYILAKNMLNKLKEIDKKAVKVMGVIAKENKKASWMTAQLGFKKVNEYESQVGTMKVSELMLKEPSNRE
jgi:hypothetical protein